MITLNNVQVDDHQIVDVFIDFFANTHNEEQAYIINEIAVALSEICEINYDYQCNMIKDKLNANGRDFIDRLK